MRLSEHQKQSILSVLSPYGQVYLYGSRVNDQLKGGDIDLLLVTQAEQFEILRKNRYKLLIQIESLVGEQKIDLTLATPEMLSQDSFLKTITTKLLI